MAIPESCAHDIGIWLLANHSLKCLWTENCFHLVLKFTFKNTGFQSLRTVDLKMTILQAFKVVLFYSQKWYLNRAAKIPRDINLWRHFVAKFIPAIWRKRGSEGGIALLVRQTSKAAKTDRLPRVYECTNFPLIRLWGPNGSSLSVDIGMISRTRRQNTLHSVRLISRIRVMNAVYPF